MKKVKNIFSENKKLSWLVGAILALLVFLFINVFPVVTSKNGDEVKTNMIGDNTSEEKVVKISKIKNYSAITENQFKNNLAFKENVEVLDIRTPQETATSKIFSDAKEIDFYINFKNNIDKLDKNKIYFIYCRSGNRSGSAKKIMKNLGFKEVYDLKGGINT